MEFNEYYTRYYRSPKPSLAPPALQWFACSRYAYDPNARRPVQYFFSRLLEHHPELREEISRARSEVPFDQPPIINEVLAATDPPNKLENAIDRPDRTEQLNDLLWDEFSLTGQPAAVERLIDLLDRPDLVRERIERWLKPSPVTRLVRQPILNRKCALLRNELGIACDTTNQCVTTLGDLDCLCGLRGLEVDKNRFQRARMILPFGLTDEDVRYILGKATAKWSLASRAREESELREICERQIDSRTGRTRLSLLEIVAFAYSLQRKHASAKELATRYLSLDPDYDGMHNLLAIVRSWLELDMLMNLVIPDARGELADLAGTAKQCVDVTEMAWSYRTRYVFRATGDSDDDAWIEWNMEYYDPGRFHVRQEARPSGDYDEWIAIGDDVWRQPFWFHRSGSELATGEHHLNTMLGAEPYLELLSRKEASGGFTVKVEGRRFAILELKVGADDKQVSILETNHAKTYKVWIDQNSSLILRVDIHLATAGVTGGSASACHVFSSYNEEISIEPPPISAQTVTG